MGGTRCGSPTPPCPSYATDRESCSKQLRRIWDGKRRRGKTNRWSTCDDEARHPSSLIPRWDTDASKLIDLTLIRAREDVEFDLLEIISEYVKDYERLYPRLFWLGSSGVASLDVTRVGFEVIP
ncbi:hypothetical protein EVAR_48367_1 [Eumeta japonica]|uniref:Uncharacterized protein n=1 Tax=Eumeta variegata TaxID=151549 RepID=A0A4C1WMD2_EUMVA|nr:hypothetical protein EVAR_48367_1 [Eumeta japonica]